MSVLKSYNKKENIDQKCKIGIIAGSGPEAGIDLWNRILDINRMRLGANYRGDLDAPSIVVFSVPELGLSMDIDNYERETWIYLKSSILEIAEIVSHFGIACNTLHYYSELINQLKINARFVSIVDAVINYIRRNNINKLAILGTNYVMDYEKWKIFSSLQDYTELERPHDYSIVHQLIYEIKRLGANNSVVKNKFISIINGLNSKSVLLACTDLSLIQVNIPAVELIVSTDILAKELLDRYSSHKRKAAKNDE